MSSESLSSKNLSSESPTSKIKIGIIGGAGYTAGELIRILLKHTNAEIYSIVSTSQAGKAISTVHDDLFGETELLFADKITGHEDVLFLCLGHEHSGNYLKENTIPEHCKIIDLSNEFRLKEDKVFENRHFIYGLPELNKNDIISAKNIANPGCFATAIQLALLPLANKNLIQNSIHISAITGSTGAGRNLSDSTHFTWRQNNISVYKTFTHQHLGEIEQSIKQVQPSFSDEVFFVPYRGDFTRGIFASVYVPFAGTQQDAENLFTEYYKNQPFTHISKKPIHLKQVVNTNNCFLNVEVKKGQISITSVIDNLIKGASGQAIQNMNMMFGLEETLGLKLKANYF